jgi:hypothetical protein
MFLLALLVSNSWIFKSQIIELNNLIQFFGTNVKCYELKQIM